MSLQQNSYIAEAERYFANARQILREKAGKQGDFYNDAKYVRMACNTTWNGLLIALNGLVRKKPNGTSRKRMDADNYRQWLGSQNKTMLKNFNSAYNYLHLLGGYDGDLRVTTSREGLLIAQTILEWIKKVY